MLSIKLRFYAGFNLAVKTKNPKFTCVYNETLDPILRCFQRNKLIFGYLFSQQSVGSLTVRVVEVYPVYFHKYPICRGVSLKIFQKNAQSLTYPMLLKYAAKSQTTLLPVILLQTNYGLVTHSEAILLRCSGQVIATLIY